MKVLVCGLGSMGTRRVRNLSELGGMDLAGFDLDAARRESAVGKYAITAFASLEQAVEQFRPDAVVVSTPPDSHMPIATRVVRQGKHVFCEAGTTTHGMAELIRLVEETDVVAVPSCTMRFQPSIKRMKEIIDSGAIGRVLAYTHHCGQYLPDWHPYEDYRTFYVSQRETGACREMVPFELTWLNWLMDGQAELVTALKGKISNLECDIDDIYQVLLRYRSGAMCHLMIDVVDRAGGRATRILGETGTLEWSTAAKELRHYDAPTQAWSKYPEPVAVVEAGYSDMSAEGMYVEEMAAFVAACQGERRYPHTFAEDLSILNTLVASEQATLSSSYVRVE